MARASASADVATFVSAGSLASAVEHHTVPQTAKASNNRYPVQGVIADALGAHHGKIAGSYSSIRSLTTVTGSMP